MATEYTSPKLDLLREHPWWKEHANRKLVLQNLPEEYRWHRRTLIGRAPLHLWPSARQAILYPSDWHNIVEHMMSTRVTEYFIVVLEDIAVQYGLESYAGVEIFRTAVANWLNSWRGSAPNLLAKVTDPDDDGHLPRVRAERWSQRVRAQKALLTKIKEDTTGSQPGYLRMTFISEVSMIVKRWAYPEDSGLTTGMQNAMRAWQHVRDAAAVTDHPITSATLFGFPGQLPDAVPAYCVPWFKTFFTKHGELLLLPKELTDQTIMIYESMIRANDLEVHPYRFLPMKETADERYARVELASGTGIADRSRTDIEDVVAAFRGKYPEFQWLRPRKAEANATVDPRRKYAVPTTFGIEPEPSSTEPEPEWAPPAMPGVGGSR